MSELRLVQLDEWTWIAPDLSGAYIRVLNAEQKPATMLPYMSRVEMRFRDGCGLIWTYESFDEAVLAAIRIAAIINGAAPEPAAMATAEEPKP